MANYLHNLSIETRARNQFIDITERISSEVEKSKVKEGICLVHVPHTTAGITINENADPDVRADILRHLEKIVPLNGDYAHGEGNSDAHIKASVMGSGLELIINGGRLALGTWQGIYFCEFDGPRSRNLLVKILSD